MIRQAAFTGNARLLKGGLHCHTTRSDGRGTPEEVIRLHAEHGYDFLAITDHRKYNYRNFAPETVSRSFLAWKWTATCAANMVSLLPTRCALAQEKDRATRMSRTKCLNPDCEGSV